MKIRANNSLLGPLVLTLLACIRVPCLYAAPDTSLRTDLNFSYKINAQHQSQSYAFVQANDDVSKCNYVEWGTGWQYQTRISRLSLLACYQQGYSKGGGSWTLEQKPSLSLNLQGSFKAFKISEQIRYEYRIAPEWRDYRLKNTINISRPDIFLQPCVGWELFYENRDQAFMLNRIKFGINKDVKKHLSASTYYRLDYSNTGGRWVWTRHLIGVQLTVKY